MDEFDYQLVGTNVIYRHGQGDFPAVVTRVVDREEGVVSLTMFGLNEVRPFNNVRYGYNTGNWAFDNDMITLSRGATLVAVAEWKANRQWLKDLAGMASFGAEIEFDAFDEDLILLTDDGTALLKNGEYVVAEDLEEPSGEVAEGTDPADLGTDDVPAEPASSGNPPVEPEASAGPEAPSGEQPPEDDDDDLAEFLSVEEPEIPEEDDASGLE